MKELFIDLGANLLRYRRIIFLTAFPALIAVAVSMLSHEPNETMKTPDFSPDFPDMLYSTIQVGQSNMTYAYKNIDDCEKFKSESLAKGLNPSECKSGTGLPKPFMVTGKVVLVSDGDTVTILVEGRMTDEPVGVSLSSIDAPESLQDFIDRRVIGQPYSEQSTMFLASTVLGKVVNAHCLEHPRLGSYVCELFVDGKSVNQEMVKQGWAWANVAAGGRYLHDKTLPALEESARASRSGLWADSSPVAPWQWRDTCWKHGVCTQ